MQLIKGVIVWLRFLSVVSKCSPVGGNKERPEKHNHLTEDQTPIIFKWDDHDDNKGKILTLESGQDDEFQLEHIFVHSTEGDNEAHLRLDITSDSQRQMMISDDEYPRKLKVSGDILEMRRMRDRSPDFVDSYLSYARRRPTIPLNLEWIDEPVLVPNVTDRETILSLAVMSSNAYVEIPGEGDWRDVGLPWKERQSIGWREDGVRGHVFVSKGGKLAVIALKGTSAALFSNGGETVNNDKINDNLLFSCCCARLSYLWNTVCDCYSGSYKCDQNCLEDALYDKDRYYKATLDIYRNVTSIYPNAEIWLTGHSLGASLASLLGRTYGLPVVAFEAPAEALPAKRLHLPLPPGVSSNQSGIYHFGHTADPIYMGTCTGPGSTCWVGGYAMETQCHSGMQCVYDTVTDLGWRVSMTKHRIHNVIDEVITQYNETPKCIEPPPCYDCYNWEFLGDEPPETSTSTTSTSEKLTKTSTLLPPTPPPTTTTSIITQTGSITGTTTTATTTSCDDSGKCLGRNWIGWCTSYPPPCPTN